ncbi:MAG: ECF-type sigma factor [Phycisphaerae bacterium]|jgi:RNA polymerase sigma factor (TIGR02999 family)
MTTTGSASPRDITLLLHDISAGDQHAAAQLVEAVYAQLRAAAQREMAHERPNHTLSATALVHEAYIKLAGPREVPWANRAHFYTAAAEAMRRILLDSAKRRKRAKRGGGAVALSLDAGLIDVRAGRATSGDDAIDPVALDAAIDQLAQQDPRAAQIVRLKYYAGLEIAHVAQAMGISERTVKNDWTFARAWLAKAMEEQGARAEGA